MMRGLSRSRCGTAPALAAAAILLLGGAAFAAPADYPTEALADYVLGCMGANGQTPDMLRRCSCSIDHIASRLGYDDYVQAETVLRLQQVPGASPNLAIYRNTPWAQAVIDKLRGAQVEAEGECFR
jgi:hypothetical protein